MAANDQRDTITVVGVQVRRYFSGRIEFTDVNGTTVRADSNGPLSALYEKLKANGA
jgi:hypothetical protein